MDLIERDGFLELLQKKFQNISNGEGHCVFVSGEAGIGKTSLVKAFRDGHKNDCHIYQGACDALFIPRPLAPLYDIMWQVNSDLWPGTNVTKDRSELFAGFFRELLNKNENTIIVFEDIHWADEATLDFVKFFARRISQLRCFFILTYREDEIGAHHPLRNVLGQLPPDSFTRLQLVPLSKQAVEKMAEKKGYNGEDVYSISGGNPFYVNEILASYSPGVPENIKDSILSVYNRQDEETQHAWQLLSILPTGFKIKYLEKTNPLYAAVIEQSLNASILILKEGILFFKHELYRRTIESSLSPLTRVCFNKKMLDLFKESFEESQELEQIIHHAKNANEYETVVNYAPLAAARAACLGAHVEASRLYLTAIEYYQGSDKNTLIQFYDSYAYECYLTNQLKEAIIYTRKSLRLWKEKRDNEKIGNCLRFLSRLWWFEGNRKEAENFGKQAIEILDKEPRSRSKAMAYSNMSQLTMLSDETDECISWGKMAIEMASELDDQETIAHALNNMGSALMTVQSSMPKGVELLKQSLKISLENSYHEHAARAYTALGSNRVTLKDYVLGKQTLDEGISYCEKRELDSLKSYMLAWSARLNLETGNWKEAYEIAQNVIKDQNQAPVVTIGASVVVATIKIRRGDADALPILMEAKKMAFATMELQRIIPVLSALLEYEWITGNTCIETNELDQTIKMISKLDKISKKNKFYYWLRKARNEYLPLKERYPGYDANSLRNTREEALSWERLGCPYEKAIALFEGSEDDKREAIAIVHGLGAPAVYEKMKMEMRTSGIRSIPRGVSKKNQLNPAFLTSRELDVLFLLREGLQNKEIAAKLFISAKTVDHHISAILFKLDVNSRAKAVAEAVRMEIIK